MDVAAWLKNLGLGQYETAFRDNGIGEAVLPHLTVEDLKEIGVATVGDRRMLLAAIAALASPTSSDAKAPQRSPARPKKDPELSAERRLITVLFCDLVGSTTISAALDAEDWRNLVSAYLDAASEAVTQMGGRVAKKLGDGLMALFGHPIAQENDSERAVRAALAIQRALAELNRENAGSGRPELVARIGVESGTVVVDATGEIFGDAPNVAARVQSVADPGTVLITVRVQRQVAGLFVAEDRGAHALKGAPEPTTLFRIVRASGGRRFGASALTPLIGREEELDLLRRRWERAVKGEGQFAIVVGEPGIGKSRLVEEFRLKLGETPHTFVEWSSSQLLQNTPLHPITEWGRQRFGADEPAARRLADLENTLRLIGLDASEYAPLLAPLVDIPLPEERAANLASEELRLRQLAALTTWVLAGARSQPVALAFEDLQWADPTSLNLMQALAERGRTAPLFIVVTTRPEFRPPWSLRPHHSVISLSPLDRAGVAQMVGELAARHALSQEVIEGVSERTGGVPLYVEEVTRLLLERGEAGGLQAIPPTLQQSLAARLDRLGDAREVAQTGAVLGRDFAYSLLHAVGCIEDPTLQSALDRLAGADLLVAEGAGREATYRFKHALIQDAAYDGLLKSRRQALHRRAAEVLRDQPERAAAGPEVVAHHFTQAGLDDLAIEWWGKAGDQALRRSAFREAIAHLGKAIAMADKAGGVSGQGQKLHVAYGNALVAARGYGAPETTEAFARAGESAFGDKDASGRLAADYGRWAGSYVRGELSAMRAHAATFLGDVQARPDQPEAGVARRVAGVTHWFAGEYVQARETLEHALALFQPGRDDDLAFRFGHDEGVAAMLYLALTLWPLGDVGRAVSLVGDAEVRMAGLAHIGSHANHRALAVVFELMRHDTSRAAMNGVELAKLAREHDLPFWRAFDGFLEGLATAQGSTASGGLEAMRRGIELLREQNVLLFDGLVKIAFAEAEARAGDPERAVASLDEALATCERIGHRTFEAELHRVRGEMLLKRDPANVATAEEALQTAIAVAQRQGTRSFELRAALALAKLYQSTARPADAHAALAPALDGFSPTPEMPEIAEAQALLAALSEAEEVKNGEARRRQRLQLQTGYAQAVAFSKGFLAEETKAAFDRASQLAGHDGGGRERFGAYYGRWIVSLTREQLDDSLAIAREFLRAAQSEGREMESGAACRALGLSHFVAGDFRSAQTTLEQAMRLHSPTHDDDSRSLFGFDPLAGAMAYLACVNLVCGELSTGRELIDAAVYRANGLDHLPTRANTLLFKAIYEAMRSDPEATLAAGNALVAICGPAGLSLYLTCGEACVGWARARGGDLEGGTAAMRRSRASLIEQGGLAFSPFFAGLLARLEAEGRRLDAASALVEETLKKAAQTGSHFSDSTLVRLRGDILLKCNPANCAPIEEAFRSAIAIAKEQGARSYELLAALALAKLYQSTARPVEAHAVLAPALEGFLPTPEMPEIAEARALLAQLGETDEVKGVEAQRRRMTQLQTAYGAALIAARGFGAPETTEAFARARESAAGDDSFERLAADYGLWVGSYVRGDLPSMKAQTAAFLADVAATPDSGEAGVAHRVRGMTHLFAGEFVEARRELKHALALFRPGRDDHLAVRFPPDPGAAAMIYLAFALWALGEFGEAASLMERMRARVEGLSHATSLAHATALTAFFALMRGDRSQAGTSVSKLAQIVRDHELPLFHAIGEFLAGWVTAGGASLVEGVEAMRRGIESIRRQNAVVFDGIIKIALAKAEVRVGDPERALAVLDEALATCDRTGHRMFGCEIRRARGELLLNLDPSASVAAEESLQAAIAIAKQQGARSYELLASLSLAKLYQSTGRPVDAHAVLMPALEGFSPTPEMPEIAEARALIERLA